MEKGLFEKTVDRIDVNAQLTSIVKAVGDNNLSEAERLLNNDKIGSGTWLTGKFMDGVFSGMKQTNDGHQKVQVLIIKLAENLAKNQHQFLMAAIENDKDKEKIIKEVKESYDRHMLKYNEYVEKAEKYALAGNDKLFNFFDRQATGVREELSKFMASMEKIAVSRGVDSKFLTNCITTHHIIMQSMIDTVKVLAGEQSSTLVNLVKESVNVINAVKGGKPVAAVEQRPNANGRVQDVTDAPGQVPQLQNNNNTNNIHINSEVEHQNTGPRMM